MMAGGGAGGAAAWRALLPPRWRRAALLLLLLWLLVTYVFISPFRCGEGEAAGGAELQERLRAAAAQLAALRGQHKALLAQIKASKLSGSLAGLELLEEAGEGGDSDVGLPGGPPPQYEALRRRLLEHTRELWHYVGHELQGLLVGEPSAERLRAVRDQLQDRKSELLATQLRLAEADGHAEWRAHAARQLSRLVQRRLRALQHPPDCRTARKLLCSLNKGCGFGCQVHHIAYCLIFAYATERTLVVSSRGWRYHSQGWEHVFRPLSDTCTTVDTDHVRAWPASAEARVVSLPFIDSITQKPKFLPLAVPKDLAHKILQFNGDPASWWLGQMLKYILQPRPAVMAAINETIAKLNFRTPIVGVHVRRTDKVGTEAAFHHIHEYMAQAQQYWLLQDRLRPAPVPRRVYLASDDASVLEEARKRYPEVEFVGDPDIARTAATHRRYTPASLAGLLVDLALLARCDYLVCTFSSQVGRVAYEMMQANRADAAGRVASLDDVYYFGGQNAHDRRATAPHDPAAPDHIAFKKGDLIGIMGNHWNGYGRGTNKRTNARGLFPWYKTEDQLVLYPFPEYRHVPLDGHEPDTPPPLHAYYT
ncbi:alpha-(1,6)-fucosyltransferase isoform X2 [Pectinophora gossypiella]|uniref:alpha-(1,6)-fucosyltransferase isoform X2 n=1 Tax=Pectinophora gossypiella TaxID=13191 RepID=UPI00214EB0C1|nr:alpha-(1,6)-fucosyltransferase isoform X2 [Pectinophora gossypiella]